MHIKVDERGLEYLELDGKKSKLSAHGTLGFLGGMGKSAKETIPSPERTYLRRQCWISADPDERALTRIVDYIGTDRLMWATDFPHPDHGGHYVRELREMLAPLPEPMQRQIAGENVRRLYRI